MAKTKLPQPPPELVKEEVLEAEIIEQEQKPVKSEPGMWTEQRLELLRRTVAKDLDTDEFMLFVEISRQRKLNPFTNQVYAQKRSGKLVIVTAIDGFRLIAQRTGQYRGQAGPWWCGDDGVWVDVWLKKEPPAAAKVAVFREGFKEPVWGLALWSMYSSNGPFWIKGGPHMLSKCAEALGLKKAFPEELSGLYTTDELDNNIDTIVTALDDPVQPTLIYPTVTGNSWTSSGVVYALVKDSTGREWLFVGTEHVGLADNAITNSLPLVVRFTKDTGRYIVTSIESV